MEIVRVISEHKRIRGKMVGGSYVPPKYPPSGYKRVMAIVKNRNGYMWTKHMDIPK